jgi:hypothetical protein
MVNSISEINSRLDYEWINNKYLANLINGKLSYKVENEYKAIDFDSGVVYHRLIGKPVLERITNRQTLFSYPLRSVFVVKIEDCDSVFLATVAQTAIREIDSMELRRDTVLSDENIKIKDSYTAIYVDYTVTEAIGRVRKAVEIISKTVITIDGKVLTIGSQLITLQ